MSFGQLERDGFDAASATPMSDINVTPLVDVMLVLLVIFIITAPLLVSTVKLELPQADSVEQVDAAQALSLVMAPDASLQLNNQPIELAALKAYLSDVARAAPDTEVLLRADTAVPYGRVVAVISAVQAAGLSRIGFVADAPDAAAGLTTSR